MMPEEWVREQQEYKEEGAKRKCVPTPASAEFLHPPPTFPFVGFTPDCPDVCLEPDSFHQFAKEVRTNKGQK